MRHRRLPKRQEGLTKRASGVKKKSRENPSLGELICTGSIPDLWRFVGELCSCKIDVNIRWRSEQQ